MPSIHRFDSPPQDASITIPARGPRLTLAALAYGGLILLWLSTENSAVWTVTLLGAGSAVWIGVLVVVNYWHGRPITQRAALFAGPLGGALLGILSAACTALLMLLKSAAHAHVYPDYPLPLLGAALARSPAWAAAGALIGLGSVLLWIALSPPRSDHTSSSLSE